MSQQTDHPNSLKSKYGTILRYALVFSLIFHITVFIAIPRYETVQKSEIKYDAPPIDVMDVPPTEQYRKPPTPERPSVPIPSPDEELPDDITIKETGLDDYVVVDQPPEPPAPPAGIFYSYDEKPKLIGGMRSLQRKIVYPEIAQEAGIEGIVFVKFFITKTGQVQDVSVIKGIPNTGLNEAAMNAVHQTKWKPAMQRDMPVGIWYTIPVRFSLKKST